MHIFVVGEYLNSFERLVAALGAWMTFSTKELRRWAVSVSTELSWLAGLVLDQVIPGAEPVSCSF